MKLIKKHILKIMILLIIIIIAFLIYKNIDYFIYVINVTQSDWSDTKKVNEPQLLKGMRPVYFTDGSQEVNIATGNMLKYSLWYDYINENKWANAKTKDGSLWVWIPRYAYKITYNDDTNRSKGGKIDIVFLKGDTNLNENNKDVTKLGYIVHPAFTDGSKTGYKNGEWKKDIKGIWISKFEAGFAGRAGTGSEKIPEVLSNITYKQVPEEEREPIPDGTRIAYPVFIGKAYAYNWVEIDEIFELSRGLTDRGNPYGLDNENTDSHMMKNSEWGAVTYLSHSKYGVNGNLIGINNLILSKVVPTISVATGYCGEDLSRNYIETYEKLEDNMSGSYAWHTDIGQNASTTGNQYGIYDLRGGSEEYISAYVNDIPKGDDDISFAMTKKSSEYVTVYEKNTKTPNVAGNYEQNNVIGDAIKETSSYGYGYTSWFSQTSIYPYSIGTFFVRGGKYSTGVFSGVFSFNNHSGHPGQGFGFRAVLIGNE